MAVTQPPAAAGALSVAAVAAAAAAAAASRVDRGRGLSVLLPRGRQGFHSCRRAVAVAAAARCNQPPRIGAAVLGSAFRSATLSLPQPPTPIGGAARQRGVSAASLYTGPLPGTLSACSCPISLEAGVALSGGFPRGTFFRGQGFRGKLCVVWPLRSVPGAETGRQWSACGGGGRARTDHIRLKMAAHTKSVTSATSMFYCAPQIDRAGEYRSDVAWLEKALAADDAMVVPVSADGGSLLARDRAVIPRLSQLGANFAAALSASVLAAAAASAAASKKKPKQQQAPTTHPPFPSADTSLSSRLSTGCFLGVMREGGAPVFAAGLKSADAAVLIGEQGKEGSAAAAAAAVGGIAAGAASTSEQVPLFADSDSEALSAAVPEGAAWVDLRKEGPNLPSDEAGLLAYARGLVEWRAKNFFCGRCGGPLTAGDAGHSLRCSTPSAGTTNSAVVLRPCGLSIYPRLDPAVIMGVTSGREYVLLGRQARWPKARYSVLAGFVEAGEAFEEAVVREVEEEAGVVVDPSSVRYVASQPWPFPSSLMIAFLAAAETAAAKEVSGLRSVRGDDAEGRAGLKLWERELVLGPVARLPSVKVTDELEDARWVHRDFIEALLQSKQSWAAGLPSEPSAAAAASPAATHTLSEADAATAIGAQVTERSADAPAAAVGTAEAATAASANPSAALNGGVRAIPAAAVPSVAGLLIPGPYAIAHVLLQEWVRRGVEEEEGEEGGRQRVQWVGRQVPDVEIGSGVFKYVLMRLSDVSGRVSKLIVRGHEWAPFHANILDHTRRKLAPLGLKVEPLGGGRMEHHPDLRVMSVYGYSQAFGQADHQVTAALLQRWLPLHTITTSDEGY